LSGQETSWVVLASTLTSHISRSSLLHVCLFVCSHTIGAMSPTRDVVLAFDTINHWTSCQDLHPVEHCASRRRSPRPTSPFSGGATLGEIEGHRPPAAWTTLTSVESLPPHTLVRESPPPPSLSCGTSEQCSSQALRITTQRHAFSAGCAIYRSFACLAHPQVSTLCRHRPQSQRRIAATPSLAWTTRRPLPSRGAMMSAPRSHQGE
jgi:hypothetical protein